MFSQSYHQMFAQSYSRRPQPSPTMPESSSLPEQLQRLTIQPERPAGRHVADDRIYDDRLPPMRYPRSATPPSSSTLPPLRSPYDHRARQFARMSDEDHHLQAFRELEDRVRWYYDRLNGLAPRRPDPQAAPRAHLPPALPDSPDLPEYYDRSDRLAPLQPVPQTAPLAHARPLSLARPNTQGLSDFEFAFSRDFYPRALHDSPEFSWYGDCWDRLAPLPSVRHSSPVDHARPPPLARTNIQGSSFRTQHVDASRRHSSYANSRGIDRGGPSQAYDRTGRRQSNAPYAPYDAGGGTRPPIYRATKACDACRKSKSRCVKGGTLAAPSPCVKCVAAGTVCVYSAEQRRRGPPPG